jgi:hypothetical protein
MAHVTFIHGISNKPPADKLLKLWLDSLSRDFLGNDDGIDLDASGITSSIIYWADVLYDAPLVDQAILESAVPESIEEIAAKVTEEPDMSWRSQITGEEKQRVDSLAAKLNFDLLVDDVFTPPVNEIDSNLERIPLPWFVKRRLMKQLLKDVHHYLFNQEFSPRPGATYKVQDEIRDRVLKGLIEGANKTGPHIVVSHSMGTVIAYDCLKRVKECPTIDGLMTIGSPLGLDEIQDMFKPEWTRNEGFPEKLKGEWINVYDTLDPVTGFDGNIANDYKKNGDEVIEVINEQNQGAWRHNITNYLSRPKFRAGLAKLLGI